MPTYRVTMVYTVTDVESKQAAIEAAQAFDSGYLEAIFVKEIAEDKPNGDGWKAWAKTASEQLTGTNHS